MKTSIVLSTYNGEMYLEEQLYSLISQKRRADEVLIIDDCSSDSTVSIIRRIIQENDLRNWKLTINPTNRGWKRNFYDGFVMASGDVVFPCDQDDIWHPDKISSMMAIIESNAEIGVLEGRPHKCYCEDRIAVDYIKARSSSVRVSVGVLLDKLSDKKEACHNTKLVQKKAMSYDFMKRAPGCVLAFRREVFDMVKQVWFEDMPHDALMEYFPLLLGRYYTFDYEVIEWRQHVGSASRPAERNKNNRIKEIELDKRMLQSINEFSGNIQMGQADRKIINQAMEWNRSRILAVEESSFRAFPQLIQYRMFYLQKRRLFTDMKYALEK